MSAIANFKSTINGKIVDLGDIASQETTHTIQISSNDPPGQRYSINFKQKVAIKTSDITVNVNGALSTGSQRISFGPRKSDIYVAASQVTTAGVGNTLSFSNDGINWYGLGTSVFDISASSVCHNGKIWVATANTSTGGNTMAYSYDGKIWIGLGKGIFTNANAVVWNGTLFVAGGQGPSVGTGNTLAYSYDGINWTGLGASVCAYNVRNIGWNGRTWVACGQSTSTRGQTASSTRGNVWVTSATSSTIFTTSCNNVAWNGYTWLGVGTGGNTIGYSTDGTTWAAVTSSTSYITANGTALAWNGKVWVAGGNSTNNLAYTTDVLGRTGWVTLGSSIFSTYVKTVKWTGKQFIALGYAGNSYAYSIDGINWVGGTTVIDANNGGSSIEYNNKALHTVTIQPYTIYTYYNYSNNGTSWSVPNYNFPLTTFSSSPKYNGKMWIAFIDSSSYQAYSYDGINWFSSNISNNIGTAIRATAWNGKLWVAACIDNSVRYSYDGLSWSLGSGTNFNATGGFYYNGPTDIRWNGTMFVVCGQGNPPIYYSYNGIKWFSAQGQGLANGVYWTVCWNGKIWTTVYNYSYDGINWIINPLGVGINGVISIDWNGCYFVCGTFNSGSNMYISFDGIKWQSTYSQYSNFKSLTWSNRIWISSIRCSHNGITWPYSGAPNADVTGTLGANYSTGFTTLGTNYGIQSVSPIPYIQHPAIAVGGGQNTIAYSDDGITWNGLGSNIFSNEGYDVFWNGQIWVAAGNGGNSLAYSRDGITWTGLGTSIFTSGSAVAHNGNIWVATGNGGNTLAYSKNGITWTGLGTRVFSSQGYGICYNGTAWVAGGSYTGASGNTMAYSLDGITWTGIGRTTFNTVCYDVAMNGSYWFAVGQGGNTIAYTTTVNGSAGWVGLGTSIFSTAGTGVAWNGQLFVFTGSGGNSLAYGNSLTSPTISGVTNSTQLLASGMGVCWNGTRFIATGQLAVPGGPGNTLAYSQDGINWYPGYAGTSSALTSTIFTVNANCVASNPGVGFPVFDSQIVLDPNGITGTSTLDFFMDGYQQQGFSQISININVNNIV